MIMTDLLPIYHPDLPPLLAALAETPPMDRLRRVGMNCGCEYTRFPVFQAGRTYNRCVHSLGVGAIVWHFTSDPAQAAAGLLHDVATPTFAHVVDFLRGDYLTQEATEAGTRELIAGSPELTAVLDRFGLTPDRVADYHLYPIADNDSPRLSADRLEYTLSNSLNYGFLASEQAADLYGDLSVAPNETGEAELCFRSRDRALLFARTALACARAYVSPADRCCMQLLSELLAKAVGEGILAEADLWADEPLVIDALERSPLAPAWEAFRSLRSVRTAPPSAEPPDDRPWRRIPAKKRCIDPLIRDQGRASALDPAFAADLSAFLSEPQTEWILASA